MRQQVTTSYEVMNGQEFIAKMSCVCASLHALDVPCFPCSKLC